jgi:Ca2+:H+ antiporter
MQLATEIAISSSAQVGLLVLPIVMLFSFAFSQPLTLAFRPIEVATMALAALLAGLVVADSRVRRWEGLLLVSAYAGMVIAFGFTPDRV